MKFGLKVHHTDIQSLLALRPEAVEFALFFNDLAGGWAKDVHFDGPVVVHAPEKYSDGVIVDIGSEVEAERSKAVDMLCRTIDIAVQLKASMVICHPGGIFRERRSVTPDSLLMSLSELKAYSKGRTELLLENMPYYYRTRGELWHSCLCCETGAIREVLEEADVRLCLDLCHAKLYCNVAGRDFYQTVKALLPYTGHIHISDAAGIEGEGLQIGDGGIDFARLKPIIGDSGVIAVPEIENGFKAGGVGFKTARDRLIALGYISPSLP